MPKALTLATRASAIQHLDIRYMITGDGKYILKNYKLYKND